MLMRKGNFKNNTLIMAGLIAISIGVYAFVRNIVSHDKLVKYEQTLADRHLREFMSDSEAISSIKCIENWEVRGKISEVDFQWFRFRCSRIDIDKIVRSLVNHPKIVDFDSGTAKYCARVINDETYYVNISPGNCYNMQYFPKYYPDWWNSFTLDGLNCWWFKHSNDSDAGWSKTELYYDENLQIAYMYNIFK